MPAAGPTCICKWDQYNLVYNFEQFCTISQQIVTRQPECQSESSGPSQSRCRVPRWAGPLADGPGGQRCCGRRGPGAGRGRRRRPSHSKWSRARPPGAPSNSDGHAVTVMNCWRLGGGDLNVPS